MKEIDHMVLIEMENGKQIKLELYPQHAPISCENFTDLVNKGFYDGLIFHRVIQGFMIQGGDPKGNGTGGPGYGIKGEFSKNGHVNNLSHEPGVISMARSAHPDSAGSQFFLMTSVSSHLDGSYAGFGRVVEGMDIVEALEKVKTNFSDKPLEDIVIESVTVDTFGVEYPEPITQ